MFALASRWTTALLLGAVAGVAHAQAPASLERTVDATIKPGDDFFGYANGSWLKATSIPAGKEKWGARDQVNEINRQRVATLLDDARTAPMGSRARRVGDFRAAWLDTVAIEKRGLAPLHSLFDGIAHISNTVDLARELGRGIRADVDPLNWGIYTSSRILGLSVEPSIHGEKQYVAFLLQGGLGLPDRENYLSAEPRLVALRSTYQKHVATMLSLAGLDRADERAVRVVALETAIAQTQATKDVTANDHNADHVWTRADFVKNAPGMDWSVFLSAAGLGTQASIVAWQPTAVTGLAALVASQPLDSWKDYLRFHALNDYGDVLPHAFADEASAFRAAQNGAPDAPREQRAIDATKAAMGDALGRLYAIAYFPAAQKARVQRIVANVTAAFLKRAEAATWMTPATKAIAVRKIQSLYVGIGYPEKWPDDSDLRIDAADAYGNQSRIWARNHRLAIAQLGKRIDMTDWWVAPHTVNAVLVFQQNAYDFAAALLQAPKFDPGASEAAAYGAIGAVIGHDVSHFVDVLGAEYDTTGAMRRWWTAEDSAHFQALARPLAEQFSAYSPFPDTRVNGVLTLNENIADLAGASAAFDAYRLALGKKAADKKQLREMDREFFIAMAQAWRIRYTDAGLRAQLAVDHAPEMYRMATVRNIDAWYEAFDVRPGDTLYLEPRARVRIW